MLSLSERKYSILGNGGRRGSHHLCGNNPPPRARRERMVRLEAEPPFISLACSLLAKGQNCMVSGPLAGPLSSEAPV